MSAAPAHSWTHDGDAVAGQVIATLTTARGVRLVLLDTADRYWLADDADPIRIVAGPTTGDGALTLAETILAGIADHHSVQALVNQLALGVVIHAAEAAP